MKVVMHDDPCDHDDQGLRKRVMVVVRMAVLVVVAVMVMVVTMVMVATSTTVRQWMQGTGLLTQVDV